MSVSQQDLDAAELLVRDGTTNGYAQLASLAIVVFDHLLTLNDEVTLVWKQDHWGIGSFLFFVNRYTGLFSLAFNSAIYLNNTLSDTLFVKPFFIIRFMHNCFHWVRYQIGGSIMAFWLVDMILALRVWALFGRSKRVLIFICSMFAVSIAFVAIVAGLIFQDVTVIHRPGPYALGCYPQGFPLYTFLLAIPEVLNSGVLLGMTLYRTIRTVRMGRKNAPLFVLFIKDGVLYYVCILFILLMNAFAFSSFTITAAASGLAIAIPCVFGSRILFNLRRQLLKQQLHPSQTSVPTIQFGAAETSENARGGRSTTGDCEIEMQFASIGSTGSTHSAAYPDQSVETEGVQKSVPAVFVEGE